MSKNDVKPPMPNENPTFQPLKTDKIVPIILVKTTLLKLAEFRKNKPDSLSHTFVTKFQIAPFAWNHEIQSHTWINENAWGISEDHGENFSEIKESIVSITPINGNVFLRPCNKCGKPVVIGFEINGVKSILFSETEPIDGVCDDMENHK